MPTRCYSPRYEEDGRHAIPDTRPDRRAALGDRLRRHPRQPGPQAEADRHVASAVERGVTYFDVAPSYGNGEAEEKLGPALEPHRAGVFLACKTNKRDAASRPGRARAVAAPAAHRPPRPLPAARDDDDGRGRAGLRARRRDGGAPRAREQGKTRFLGFCAHSAEAAVALLERFPFDSVLSPFNFAAYQGNFGPQIVAAAQRAGAGLLALKGMARTKWPEGLAREQRRWPKAGTSRSPTASWPRWRCASRSACRSRPRYRPATTSSGSWPRGRRRPATAHPGRGRPPARRGRGDRPDLPRRSLRQALPPPRASPRPSSCPADNRKGARRWEGAAAAAPSRLAGRSEGVGSRSTTGATTPGPSP